MFTHTPGVHDDFLFILFHDWSIPQESWAGKLVAALAASHVWRVVLEPHLYGYLFVHSGTAWGGGILLSAVLVPGPLHDAEIPVVGVVTSTLLAGCRHCPGSL
jgi:hypothetical protein